MTISTTGHDLLVAVDHMVSMFGEDQPAGDGLVGLVLTIVAFRKGLPNPGATREPVMVFHDDFNPSLEALELFMELEEFSDEGFTLGEIYDAIAERVLATLEASS